MPALLKFLVLLAIFLLESNANAFTSSSPVAGNQVQENQWFQFVEPMIKPTNKPTGEPTDSSKNQWQMPTTINLGSSGLSHATTMMDQEAHLHLASPRSYTVSACKPFSTICSFQYGLSSSIDHSLAVIVQASSTLKVSRYAFALLAFEPVTSAKQISLPKTALNATAEMQLSADISQNLGTELIFQLIDVSISNKDEMCSASQLVANEHKGLFNDETVSTFRLIVRFKQQYQSQMQRDLVDFSSSKAISNAKLAKNDFQLIVDLTLIPNREGLCAVQITSYSPSEGECNFSVSEGVQAQSNIQVYCCVDFVALIIIPNFTEASMLIVKYHYSKISLPFCEDSRIFCEGVNDVDDDEDKDIGCSKTPASDNQSRLFITSLSSSSATTFKPS